ncbi:hypothetical protein ABPG73_004504 [Tetrahymena malaccensis]
MQGNIKLGNKVDDYQMGFSQGGLKLGVVEEKEEEMNKLNSIILSLLILVTFVRALPFACGNGTDCSACGDTPEISSQFIPPSPMPGNNVSGSCSGCGATNQIQSLFTPISGSNCKVTDCSQSPGSYNSYVCQSCYQASGAIAALNIGNFYNPATSACVASCPNGTSADNTNTCQPIPTKPGNNVSCGSSVVG